MSLHTALNGGSLTSSIGASSSGKSGNIIWSILTILGGGDEKSSCYQLPFILSPSDLDKEVANLQSYFSKT